MKFCIIIFTLHPNHQHNFTKHRLCGFEKALLHLQAIIIIYTHMKMFAYNRREHLSAHSSAMFAYEVGIVLKLCAIFFKM